MAQTVTKDTVKEGKKKRASKINSTQTHLRIGEIHDDVLVLKNGGLRAILKTSSINFNLKSEQEQKAIIQAYQSFLNSLEFPIQIVVRSRKLDIDDYIEQVKAVGKKQTNQLLQDQTYEYAEYVKKLVDYADIMEKNFYVVIPYNPARAAGTSIFQSFFQRISPKENYGDIKKRHKEFDNLKKALAQRVNVAKAGLEACGLTVDQLNTKEIVELFYDLHNPQSARHAKIKNLEETDLEQ